MKGFRLALAANTSLEENPGGYYLVSRVPLRVLRVNRPLFQVLKRLEEGNAVPVAGELLKTLLGLAARGYLDLEAPPLPGDFPLVSVIIPVKDRHDDLLDCLRSLQGLDWPAERMETIVVDDGSTPPVAAPPGVRVLRQDVSRGPAAARNLAAGIARGDILAFLDADCLAGRGWLRELAPFFEAPGVAAVGGYVAGYYRGSFLDRYEHACSSLNLGQRLMLEGPGPSTLYVPTASMLVRRDVFISTAGFDELRRVGEDVDFCWRMRNAGWNLVYAPFGRVAHKHRNKLGRMLRRRAQYGTSEAGLYRTHRDKRKIFVAPILPGAVFLAVAASVLLLSPYPLIAVPFLFGLDVWRRAATIKKTGLRVPLRQLAASTLRSGWSLFYFVFFHLVRYYLFPLLALGFLWQPVWAFAGLALAVTSAVDFYVKKPRLPYPVFLFFYLLEHLAYQVGVFIGCLRARSFVSYRLSFRRG